MAAAAGTAPPLVLPPARPSPGPTGPFTKTTQVPDRMDARVVRELMEKSEEIKADDERKQMEQVRTRALILIHQENTEA